MAAIHFYFNGVHKPTFFKAIQLKHWIKRIIVLEQKQLHELSYIFCDDETLLKINQDYLSHDTYTDIITFDLGTSPNKIEGEIYTSIDRLYDNAKKFKVSLDQEWLRVMAHGVLHLCGYKDKSKSDQLLMRQKEEDSMALYHQEFLSK